MAFELIHARISLPAAASFTSNQFYAGVVDTNGNVALQTTAGGRVDGVIYSDNPTSGTAVDVVTGGVAMLATGAGVAAGDSLEADATGRAITATGTSGHKVFATALASSSAAGQIIPALLHCVA